MNCSPKRVFHIEVCLNSRTRDDIEDWFSRNYFPLWRANVDSWITYGKDFCTVVQSEGQSVPKGETYKNGRGGHLCTQVSLHDLVNKGEC